jgi:ABC-2 type transport system permease protein
VADRVLRPDTNAVEAMASRSRPSTWSAYRAVLGSRVRSKLSYRVPFAVDCASAFLVGLVEFAEVMLVFSAVGRLGGIDIHGILLVFALAELGFCLGDLVFGHLDTLPDYLRAGTLDVFYLRPQPLLVQLVTSDISLRRLARAVVGLTVLVVALRVNDITWTAPVVTMLVLALACSPLIYGALFVAAAGIQFFTVNAPEMPNAITYGGRYAATTPASVWPGPMRVFFGFLAPVAFTGYLPALVILDLPGGGILSQSVAWFLPLATASVWTLAGATWRVGVRHYQGGGG